MTLLGVAASSGPEYRNTQTGDPYLYLWCDRDDLANRWPVFPTTEPMLLRYHHAGRMTPRDVVLQAPEQIVHLLDIDAEFDVQSVSLLSCGEIRQEYLPGTDSYFDSELLPVGADSDILYHVLLN